jgi:hypothetical protein
MPPSIKFRIFGSAPPSSQSVRPRAAMRQKAYYPKVRQMPLRQPERFFSPNSELALTGSSLAWQLSLLSLHVGSCMYPIFGIGRSETRV